MSSKESDLTIKGRHYWLYFIPTTRTKNTVPLMRFGNLVTKRPSNSTTVHNDGHQLRVEKWEYYPEIEGGQHSETIISANEISRRRRGRYTVRGLLGGHRLVYKAVPAK